MGTTMATVVVVVALLWVVGTPLRYFGVFLVTLVGIASVLAVAEPYRMARLVAFLDPCAPHHRLDGGFQACQGLLAMGSGGIFGVGLGASREKWAGGLPNAHTDFVFAIIGEELGLLGSLTVLALFATLVYGGLPGRQAHHRPVRPARRRGRHHLARRAGRDQHRRGRRPAADHRHPAAAGQLRRLVAAAHPRRDRDAAVVRPLRARRPRGAGRPVRGAWPGSSAGARCPSRRYGPPPAGPGAARPGGGEPAMTLHVVVAGGGTAGHVEPALAVADALRRLAPDTQVTALGTAARARGPSGAGPRLPAGRDPARAAAAPAHAGPAARARPGRWAPCGPPPPTSTASAPTSSSASAATSRCPPTWPPAGAARRWSCTRPTRGRAWPTGSAPG